MKIKKPEIVTMFKCSTGPMVETLPLWQASELMALIRELPDSKSYNVEPVAQFMIENAERFVAILALKERGRPNGSKDRKPRVKRVAETVVANAVLIYAFENKSRGEQRSRDRSGFNSRRLWCRVLPGRRSNLGSDYGKRDNWESTGNEPRKNRD